MQPKGAQCQIKGVYYRVGVRGMPFAWINGEWVRTTKSAAEVERNKLKTRNPSGRFWQYMKVGDRELISIDDRLDVQSTMYSHGAKYGKRFSVKTLSDSVCEVERVA